MEGSTKTSKGWKFGNMQKLPMVIVFLPKLFVYIFNSFGHRGLGGGALHKNNTKTTVSNPGVMGVSEFNYQHSR